MKPAVVFAVVLGASSARSQAIVTYDQPLDAIRRETHIYAFTTAQNGHLDVNWWDGRSWQFSDRGLPRVGIGAHVAPAAITFVQGGARKVQAFVTGKNGHLFGHLWNGSGWRWSDEGNPAGAKLSSSPVAIVHSERGVPQISVFAAGNDGCLYVRWWDGTQWHWSDLNRPQGAGVSSSPSAVTWREGAVQRHHVFVVGDDGRLYVCWWTGAAWTWTDLGAPPSVQLVSTPSAVTFTRDSVRRVGVYATGDDGRVWRCAWNGTAWGWSDAGAPAGTPFVSSPRAAVFDPLGQSTGLLAVAQGGQLLAKVDESAPWQPAPVSTGVKSLIGAISLRLGFSSNNLLALFAGADGRVATASWDGQRWNPWDAGSPAGVSPPVAEVGHFLVSDVSPDAAPRTDFGIDAGGRMRSIVVSPWVTPEGQTVYVASELGGVWKSTDSAAHWRQVNKGLTTGRSAGSNRNLALDDQSPARLIYATADDDFRVTHRGGLWVTFDGAANWQHVDLPGCPDPNLGVVTFAAGRAYALSYACNAIFTSTALRNGTWTRTMMPVAGPIWHLSANQNTVFVCNTTQVFRGTVAAGALTWDTNGRTLTGECWDLAALPTAASQASQVLVDSHTAASTPEIFRVDFSGTAAPVSLGFNAAMMTIHGSSTVGGSGLDGLFAVRRAGTGPEQFDVFFGNNLQYFQTQSPITANSTSAQWIRISYAGGSGSPHLIHDDTQGMAFSPTWNGTSDCLAYATSDGGVSKRRTCDAWSWAEADVGLHGYKSQYIAGIARGYCGTPRRPCASIYIPSGDNGAWYSPNGGPPGSWLNMRGGDAGFASMNPAMTGQLYIDGTLYVTTDGSPPVAGTPAFGMYSAADVAASIGQPRTNEPPQLRTPQILTKPGEPATPDFLAMKSVSSSDDTVVRSVIANRNGTYVVSWLDIAPNAHFAGGSFTAVVGAGGHARTVIYALGRLAASTGTLFRGAVDAATRQVTRWDDRSAGCAATGVRLVMPVSLIVDPWDANVVYVTDTGDQTIKVSPDGGQCWRVDTELTRLATRGGEFRFTCAGAVGTGDRFCPLQQVVFDPRDNLMRVAVTFPGGLALSRDGGVSWVSITGNTINRPDAQDVTTLDDFNALPMSVFFDPNGVGGIGRPVGGSLYVALLGRGLVRVDIPRP